MSKDDDPRVKLGKAIRERRLELGLSQEELANRAGIHVTYLSSVERGHRNVALLNIVNLAQALILESSDLMKMGNL